MAQQHHGEESREAHKVSAGQHHGAAAAAKRQNAAAFPQRTGDPRAPGKKVPAVGAFVDGVLSHTDSTKAQKGTGNSLAESSNKAATTENAVRIRPNRVQPS